MKLLPLLFPSLLLLGHVAPAQDKLVLQALQRIERCEKAVQTLQPGDVAGAQGCLADLDWAAKRLNASYDKKDEHYLAAVKRYEAVRKTVTGLATPAGTPAPATIYDADKLRQLDKEIGNGLQNFKLLGLEHMGDASRVGGLQRELGKLRQRLEAFPVDDAQVKTVAGHFAEFDQAFRALHQRYQEDLTKAGAHNARMVEFDVKYQAEQMPVSPQAPFELDQLRSWAAQVRRWREVELPQDVAWLQSIAGAGGVDRQHASRLQSWIGESWVRRLDEEQSKVGQRVQSDVAEAMRTAAWVQGTDPTDANHVANRILGEGAFDGQMQRLQAGLQAIDTAAVYDQAFDLDKQPEATDRKTQRAAIEAAIEHLRQVAVVALDQVRMPAAKSSDAALLAIARETLGRKKYGVGAIEQLVINMDKQHREMESGSISRGTVNSTVTIYKYVWDEFQVCTAEKEGDEYWMYFNTLKRYSSGDTTTPIDTWILSKRFKSTRILQKNL